jgi:hypothetical protein
MVFDHGAPRAGASHSRGKCHLGHLILIGEEGGQLRGKLRMLAQQRFVVRRLACVHRLQVGVKDRFELLVPGGVVRYGIHGLLQVVQLLSQATS